MALQPPAPGVTPRIDTDEDEQARLKMAMLALQAPNQQVEADPANAMTPPVPSVYENPPTTQPDVTLAHASMADQPATKWVNEAQGQLSDYQNRPMWKKLLPVAMIAGASMAGARGWGGKQLVEQGAQSMHDYNMASQARQQSLMNQVQAARGQQMSEYELDQRNRQQDLITAANNENRKTLTGLLVQGKLGAAQIGADSRETVADTAAGARRYVVDTQGTTARDVANMKGGYDIHKAQIEATAALNRFLAGQARMDARQQAGFAHTDMKPTADEDRRADLLEALVKYAGMLKDIASRRPELFGNMGFTLKGALSGQLTGGRATRMRQAMGTEDADVAMLQMTREQLGIVQMGSHSLRSAAAIAPIADSLVNSFNNSADVIMSTADGAISGVQNFINGPVRPTVYAAPAGQTPPANAGPPAARAPLASKVGAAPATEAWTRVGGKLAKQEVPAPQGGR